MNKDELLAQALQEYQAARVAAMEKAVRKPKPEPKVLSLPTPEVRERPKILPQSRRWAAAAATPTPIPTRSITSWRIITSKRRRKRTFPSPLSPCRICKV